MRKLTLALMALACLTAPAVAQQQQKFTADQGAAGAAPWPVTWTGQSVNADLRVGGAAVAAGNPVPVSVAPLPAGTAIIGKVGIDQTTPGTTNGVAINSSVVLPVYVNGSAALPLAAGTNTIGSVNVLGGNATAVKTDGSGVTQPISAASLPLPPGAAQDGADPASPAIPNAGSGIRGWLATIAGRSVGASYYLDLNGTSVSAGGISYGPAHDAGASPSQYTKINAVFILSAVSNSTGNVQFSDDGTSNWTTYATATVGTANFPTSLTSPIYARYWRTATYNGAGSAATATVRAAASSN